jgi:purine-binding chemotaxis protein CheW
MNNHEVISQASDATAPDRVQLARQLAGKYMTFRLAGECYGIEVLKVRELIRLTEITRVPGTKRFIRGVINLRGRITPVVDPGLKFGMGELKATEQTVIIVVQCSSYEQDLTMGMLVDEVLEVMNVAPGDIEPPPDFGTGAIDTDYLLGVAKADKRVVMLMDIGKVLTAEEIVAVSQTGTAGAETPSPADGDDHPKNNTDAEGSESNADALQNP